MKALISILMILSLSGCATLNESECVETDWQKIGEDDGSKGQLQSHLDEHQKACEKHGISVEKSNYLAGRNEGIKSYCTVKNAYTEGMRGNEYGGVCPQEYADEFLPAYVVGLKIRLDSLHLEYNRLDFELFTARYRQPHHSHKKPHHRWQRNEFFALRNHHRKLFSEQLTLQRWITYWSKPNT